jgi:hypothetical protein
VASLDPIEDSQTRSATSPRIAAGRHRGHRVAKLSTARTVEAGRSALLLHERSAHICSTKYQGPQSSTSSRHKFAIASDGFVGSELNLQHTASQQRPRTSNRTLTKKKKSAYNKSELTLASGYLPEPLVEHQHNDMATLRLHTAGSRTGGIANFADESQRAIAEITMVTTEKQAREHLRSRTQRYDGLVRNQLSNVMALSRHLSENSSFDSANDADEVVTHSHSASHEADQIDEQSTPHWLRTPSTGPAYDLFEDEQYFKHAVRDPDAEGRSDSVNGEFWSQYGGLERSDGAWDARGATALHHL